ncbi:MAG: UDP-N-acetylglucosamine 4,6-dehydratase (inverting) [Bacteroidota bacterium]
MDLKNKSLLITGGTGSFGTALIKRIVTDQPDIGRLIIFSRDELKQFELSQKFPVEKYPFIRYFLGDIRDQERVRRAFNRVDYVIHAAALKQVPAAEYNPMEFIKTNVIGAENIINAAIDSGVKRVVALSTDKAAAPVNLYGATKLCSDKLFVAANNMAGGHDIKFSVVRYGNVMGSRGSVIPFFLNKRNSKELPITHPEMTRFNITLSEGVDLVLKALEHSWGGEIYVPKLPSFKVTELAEAIAPNASQKVVGIRPGEKIHEEMITIADSTQTYESENHFVILPNQARWKLEDYLAQQELKKVDDGFYYNSGENSDFLNKEELRGLIKSHIDKDFEPL